MKKIESELKEWFSYIQNKYTWLSIKYEYSEWRECYLVSFSPVSKISKDLDFCQEAMDFTDKLHDEYGDFAPLFCDEESLFKLSNEAKVLPCKKSYTTMENIEIISISLPLYFDNLVTVTQDSHEEFVNRETYYTNDKYIAA